jgi:tetratricopeptide (TPR) repeat protein
MPGNRAIFDRALEQSREAARQSRWDDALKTAVRALQEFPQDVDARVAAALALVNTGRYNQALQILAELRAADPDNVLYLGYIARCQAEQGDVAAIDTYRHLIELHRQQRSSARIIMTLRELLQLRDDLDAEREQLAQLLFDTNAGTEAAGEYLKLARRYYAQQRLDEAAERAEQVLRIDPQNHEAKELLVELREAMSQAFDPNARQSAPVEAADNARMPGRGGMTGSLRSQHIAAERLVAMAQEQQEAGDLQAAIEHYEQAIAAGMDRADVFYSLGLLHQELGDHRAAVQALNRSTGDPEYALSSHFALGASYRELNQLPQAAQEFEQTIRLVDLETIGRNESEDLIQMYENAAGIYEQIGDIARAAELYKTLAAFLGSKRWGRERAQEFNQRAKELTERNMFAKLRTLGTGALAPAAEISAVEPEPESEAMPETWGKIRSITDFLRADRVSDGHESTPGIALSEVTGTDPLDLIAALPAAEMPSFAPITPLSTAGLDETVERWVLASAKYIEQGLLEAALDACHEVIRLDVEYVLIHLRMGEIYERQERNEDALTKYQLLIDTLNLRGEAEQAIPVYYRLIELSPDTGNARAKLAELLRNAGRTDEAAEQLAQVAANYFRLGQTNRALEEYRRLLQWAPKSTDAHAQYGLMLLKLERFEAALGEFRKALELSGTHNPVGIARMNMTLALMADQPAAVWDSLAAVIEQLKEQPQQASAVHSEYRSVLVYTDAPILHYIFGILLQHAGQHSAALLEFEQTMATLDTEIDLLLPPVLVHQAMADSYIALGQAEDALDQLRRGQAVAGRNTSDAGVKHFFAVPLSKGDLARRMAEAYAASDDLAGAEQALLEARRHLPYDRTVYTKLADVYFRQGRLADAITQLDDLATHYETRQELDRAIEMLDYGLKLAPSSIALGSRLARMQLRRGYLNEGIEGLVRTAEMQRKAGQLKDAVASLQEAAQVYWMLSDHEKARQLYDRIVHIAPNDIEARQWLALMYTLAGRTGDAILEKKQIARIFLQQRDYESAIAELHQIIGLSQTDQEAFFMLGDMLMRREEYNQAVRIYSRLLSMEGVETERVEALIAAANRMLAQQQSPT